MEVRIASQPAPGRAVNEDYAFALPRFVGVLDGVSVPAGLETGCIHGPAWYVRRLAARLIAGYVRSPDTALSDHLAVAIEDVRADHDGSCDLNHPGTPAGTTCLLKEADGHIEYLVLCDSPLVVDCGSQVYAIADERFARAVADLRTTDEQTIGTSAHAGRVRHIVTRQRRRTNQPDGYWIAAANPDAAHHAVTGTLPLTGPHRVRRAALLTDGASCAVEQFRLFDWRGLLDVLTEHGGQHLIDQVRAEERADSNGYGNLRYKRHDDATVALCLFEQETSHE